MNIADARIATRLELLAGILLSAVLIVGLASWRTMETRDDRQRDMTATVVAAGEAVDVARSAQVEFKKQVQEWKDLLIRGGDPAKFDLYRQAFIVQDERTGDQLIRLRSMFARMGVDTAELDISLKTHQGLRVQYLKALEHYDAAHPAASVQVVDAIVAGIDREPTRKIDDIVAFIQNHAKAVIRANEEQSSHDTRAAGQFLIGVVALALVIGSALSYVLSRSIALPLREFTHRAGRIARGEFVMSQQEKGRTDEIGLLEEQFNTMVLSLREKADLAGEIARGNLTVQLPQQSEQDILGQAFSTMAANLRELTRQIGEGVNVLAGAASEIVAGTTQMAASGQQTAAAITETSATVEEIRQTATLSGQKAQYVADMAQQTVQVSLAGRQTLAELAEGMGQIRLQMDAITDSIVRLSEQSQAIGEIINTVNSLSEQSNLLAVNAAIEAANAGEHGKGFAIVAQEVKSLAEQSKQATVQVRTLLWDIQKATGGAVLATELGGKAVASGTRQLKEAGEAIAQLSESIAESAQAVGQIDISAQQQLLGIEQLRLAMRNIQDATEQNTQSMRQAEVAAHNLHALGQTLKGILARFKV